MKNKNTRKSSKITLADKIVPPTIVALSLFIVIYNLISASINSVSNINNEVALEVENTEEIVTTTEEEYKLLQTKCKEYAVTHDSITSNISTYITITENKYIDANSSTVNNNEDTTLHETGPIYLKDKLILRYINEKGEIKVVASKLIREEDNIYIDTVDSSNLQSIYTEESTNNEYLSSIKDIFTDIIQTNNIDKNYYKYFTLDGISSTLNSTKNIKDKNISVTFIDIGKSNISIEYNDRIMLQINNNTNIIIKINKDNKIFDIDLL